VNKAKAPFSFLGFQILYLCAKRFYLCAESFLKGVIVQSHIIGIVFILLAFFRKHAKIKDFLCPENL